MNLKEIEKLASNYDELLESLNYYLWGNEFVFSTIKKMLNILKTNIDPNSHSFRNAQNEIFRNQEDNYTQVENRKKTNPKTPFFLMNCYKKVFRENKNDLTTLVLLWKCALVRESCRNENEFINISEHFIRKYGEPLEEDIVLYRGERFDSDRFGYSWTTNIEVAKKFGYELYKVNVPKGTKIIDTQKYIYGTFCDILFGWEKEYVLNVNDLDDSIEIENITSLIRKKIA